MQQVGEQRNGWATTRKDTQGDRWLDKSDRQVLTSCPYLCGTIQVLASLDARDIVTETRQDTETKVQSDKRRVQGNTTLFILLRK